MYAVIAFGKPKWLTSKFHTHRPIGNEKLSEPDTVASYCVTLVANILLSGSFAPG